MPDFRTDDERALQRSGDRLKQELINMAGKALVSMPCFCKPPNFMTTGLKLQCQMHRCMCGGCFKRHATVPIMPQDCCMGSYACALHKL